MKLQQLVQTNNWLSVKLILLQLYPGETESIEAYESVFNRLQNLQSMDSEIEIVLSMYDDNEDNEQSYVDVSGRKQNNINKDATEGLAIEFVPWNEWLGMTINEGTLRNFTELEIISHCLYELTFIDFDEQSIQEEFKKLNDTIEEYKNMTGEEKKNNTITLDDLLKNIESKDESENS